MLAVTQPAEETVELLERLFRALADLVPALIVIVLILGALWAANWVLLRRKRDLGQRAKIPRIVAMVLLTAIGVVMILLVLPVGDQTRGQLLSLLGLLLTGVIALSSTTLVSNAMAGAMLRLVRNFRTGDFIRVGKHFGRVSERGLFHTEIQTEERDLVTLPNLFLVTNPIEVIRSSGTFVSATVSLGYDVAHDRIDSLLVEAARSADLHEPYVQVKELGDFSVTYRVAGFLPEPKQIITARSRLRAAMLDTLHGGGVEIVSPSFMNQRRLGEDTRVIPSARPARKKKAKKPGDEAPQDLIFDKAEEAEKREGLEREREELMKEIEDLETRLKDAEEADRRRFEHGIQLRKLRAEAITKRIKPNENH